MNSCSLRRRAKSEGQCKHARHCPTQGEAAAAAGESPASLHSPQPVHWMQLECPGPAGRSSAATSPLSESSHLPENASKASTASRHLGLGSLGHFIYQCALVRQGPATRGITFPVQACRVCVSVCVWASPLLWGKTESSEDSVSGCHRRSPALPIFPIALARADDGGSQGNAQQAWHPPPLPPRPP